MYEISTYINKLTMSSREIADLTGKRHDNVRADIAKMAQILSLTFQEKAESSGGRPVMAYHLGKRETLILVSGYSIELRARIIDRWQELESAQAAAPAFAIPQTLGEALRLAANLADRVVQQDERIAHLTPRAEAAERLLEADGCLPIQDVAKTLNFGPLKFFDVLRAQGYLMPNSTRPYQRHVDAGLFVVRASTWKDRDGIAHITPRTLVTSKGLLCLRKRLLADAPKGVA